VAVAKIMKNVIFSQRGTKKQIQKAKSEDPFRKSITFYIIARVGAICLTGPTFKKLLKPNSYLTP
jgi:hypothetical protein